MEQIGIIEICEKGHYMLTNALIKTYLSNSECNVVVFTFKEAYLLLKEQNPESNHLKYVLLEDFKSPNQMLDSINNFNLNRLHIATVTKYYKAFYQFTPNSNCLVFFHFHNIDLWFISSVKLQFKRLYNVFINYNKEVKIIRNLKYSLKEVLRDFYRKKFINKVKQNYRLVILSEAQRFHLNHYLNAEKAIIFPTLIFEPEVFKDTSGMTSQIRICIPGSVTQARREYFKLFDVIEQNIDFYKNHYIFDLLGFLPPDELKLEERIESLKNKGLTIYFYKDFIDSDFFDRELYKSDFILSNILLSEDNKIQSKETAAVYHMIRGAKPGIFPIGFQLDSQFIDSVITFQNYSKIHNLFIEIENNRDSINKLKENALKLSLRNSPKELRQTLYLNH